MITILIYIFSGILLASIIFTEIEFCLLRKKLQKSLDKFDEINQKLKKLLNDLEKPR